ncbi:MAG: hypothetical protein PHI06_08520 [Desulfobulbaceae bacterium]|nr:hypothetical protein [Desulfobulbaceae bacterium]
METVLLAINGATPDRKAINYAIDLCMRIKADLKILQVVSPRNLGSCLSKIKSTAQNAKRFLEDSMLAVAFAEAEEHATATTLLEQAQKKTDTLLHESAKSRVNYELLVKTGDTAEEIINYVRENNDIVITVYDKPRDNATKSCKRQRESDLELITNGVSIPVVMIEREA